MARLRVVHCPLADREHAGSRRQYAHVFHRHGIICVAHAFHDLPATHAVGITLHEIGHVLAGPHAGEQTATHAAEDASGIRIRYVTSRHGRALEWIEGRDIRRARAFLRDFICED